MTWDQRVRHMIDGKPLGHRELLSPDGRRYFVIGGGGGVGGEVWKGRVADRGREMVQHWHSTRSEAER